MRSSSGNSGYGKNNPNHPRQTIDVELIKTSAWKTPTKSEQQSDVTLPETYEVFFELVRVLGRNKSQNEGFVNNFINEFKDFYRTQKKIRKGVEPIWDKIEFNEEGKVFFASFGPQAAYRDAKEITTEKKYTIFYNDILKELGGKTLNTAVSGVARNIPISPNRHQFGSFPARNDKYIAEVRARIEEASLYREQIIESIKQKELKTDSEKLDELTSQNSPRGSVVNLQEIARVDTSVTKKLESLKILSRNLNYLIDNQALISRLSERLINVGLEERSLDQKERELNNREIELRKGEKVFQDGLKAINQRLDEEFRVKTIDDQPINPKKIIDALFQAIESQNQFENAYSVNSSPRNLGSPNLRSQNMGSRNNSNNLSRGNKTTTFDYVVCGLPNSPMIGNRKPFINTTGSDISSIQGDGDDDQFSVQSEADPKLNEIKQKLDELLGDQAEDDQSIETGSLHDQILERIKKLKEKQSPKIAAKDAETQGILGSNEIKKIAEILEIEVEGKNDQDLTEEIIEGIENLKSESIEQLNSIRELNKLIEDLGKSVVNLNHANQSLEQNIIKLKTEIAEGKKQKEAREAGVQTDKETKKDSATNTTSNTTSKGSQTVDSGMNKADFSLRKKDEIAEKKTVKTETISTQGDKNPLTKSSDKTEETREKGGDFYERILQSARKGIFIPPNKTFVPSSKPLITAARNIISSSIGKDDKGIKK